MSESSIQVPIWDITLSRSLAFADIESKIIDYAIDIGSSSALDEYGVAFDLFTPEEFAEYFGADPQPRPAMGPCTGHSADIATWNSMNQLTLQQKAKRILLKASLCSLVPRELLTPMEDHQGSLRSRSSQFIFASLRAQLGVLTMADLDLLHRKLKKQYDRSIPVETFVAEFQSTLRALARAQQPLSNNMAINTLQGCFNPEWVQCWVKFAGDYPVLAARTVENLCQSIIIFARDALPILAAQQAIGISLAREHDNAEIAALREQVAALTALVATEKKQPTGGTRASTRPRAAWRDVPLKDRNFCWSCGPCGHLGADCRSAKPGHQVAATYRNQLQSTWKALFTGRGWPII